MNHPEGNMKIKNRLLFILLLVFISNFTYGENMIKREDKFKIALLYKGNGIVSIHILNTSNETLSIPCYKLQPTLEEDVLEIQTFFCKRLQYIGKLVKRDPSISEKTIFLKPREQIKFEINLFENYKKPLFSHKLRIRYSSDLGQTNFIIIKL